MLDLFLCHRFFLTIHLYAKRARSFFGIAFRVPRIEYGETTTLVAINVGGALIPTLVSFYLLWRLPSAIAPAMISVAAVALVTHIIARPVRGVGIVTPAFIPPLVAASSAYLFSFEMPQIVAYVAGVLGTLIGADLSNILLFKNSVHHLQA